MLFEGAVALLRAGQGGSGGDLGCFLVQVFGKAEWRVEGGEGCRGLFLFFLTLAFCIGFLLDVVVGFSGSFTDVVEFREVGDAFEGISGGRTD